MPPPIITEMYIASAIEPDEQILHVLDVGIELDDLERDVLHNAVRDHRLIERIDQRLHLALDAAAHDLVGVVDHQPDARRILRIHPPRVLRGNDHRRIHLAGAHVFSAPGSRRCMRRS